MEKKKLDFDNYLSDVHPDFIPYVMAAHNKLVESGCEAALTAAKSGHVVSYKNKAKKVVANFVARKGGPQIRIYGDNFEKYLDAVKALPEDMIGAIKRSSDCKRLIDPKKCNSRCPLGYAMRLDGAMLRKCRYGAFMFAVNEETAPHILTLLDKELKARNI